MALYIQIENGQPINHPAYDDNLVAAFGLIPNDWEPFVRVPNATLGIYQVLDSNTPTYSKVNNVWTDVWSIRDMTADEKSAKQQKIKTAWSERFQASNWSAWTFDDATCAYLPPIPRPEKDQTKLDQKIYTYWCGAESNWKDTPPYPNDGNQYTFDFFAWVWVVVPSTPTT